MGVPGGLVFVFTGLRHWFSIKISSVLCAIATNYSSPSYNKGCTTSTLSYYQPVFLVRAIYQRFLWYHGYTFDRLESTCTASDIGSVSSPLAVSLNEGRLRGAPECVSDLVAAFTPGVQFNNSDLNHQQASSSLWNYAFLEHAFPDLCSDSINFAGISRARVSEV